jgi:hypothetical protein
VVVALPAGVTTTAATTSTTIVVTVVVRFVLRVEEYGAGQSESPARG